MTYLIVPGLKGSGPDHWQSLWQEDLADCRRVQLGDWNDPTRTGWIARLDAAVAASPAGVVLVAHSLGCLAVAWWAGLAPERAAKVSAALLVAPPDADLPQADARIRRFAPVPRYPLPFPSCLVASRNDPYMTLARAREVARDWSAGFHDAGEAGHINPDTGHGCWVEGRGLLANLVATIHSRSVAPQRLAGQARG